MNGVVFIYNELLNPTERKKLLFPFHFISFAYIYGKLYDYREDYIAVENNKVKRSYGNNKIYGAIYAIPHFEHYIRILDSKFACSLSMLGKNNEKDLMHRKVVQAIPIDFNTLDDIARMKYENKKSVELFAYMGNTNNYYIKHRIDMERYREIDGVDKVNFKKQYEGVME